MGPSRVLKKIKEISIFSFLALLTAGIIFLPQWISDQNEQNLLKKQYSDKISLPDTTRITAGQIAKLFCDNEFVEYKFINEKNSSYDAGTLYEKAAEVLAPVFGDDPQILTNIKDFIGKEDSAIYCDLEQEIVFMLVDTSPVAVYFSHLDIRDNLSGFELAYEEKTKALLYFSFYNYRKNELDDKAVYPLEKIAESQTVLEAVIHYYEDFLGLDEKNYYCEYSQNPYDSFICFGLRPEEKNEYDTKIKIDTEADMEKEMVIENETIQF